MRFLVLFGILIFSGSLEAQDSTNALCLKRNSSDKIYYVIKNGTPLVCKLNNGDRHEGVLMQSQASNIITENGSGVFDTIYLDSLAFMRTNIRSKNATGAVLMVVGGIVVTAFAIQSSQAVTTIEKAGFSTLSMLGVYPLGIGSIIYAQRRYDKYYKKLIVKKVPCSIYKDKVKSLKYVNNHD